MFLLQFDLSRAHSLVGSTIVQTAVKGHSSSGPWLVIPKGDASQPLTEVRPLPEGDACGTDPEPIGLPPLEWSSALEQEFKTLAEKEALGKLNPKEEASLGQLSDLRRSLKTPRSGEELVWEFEARQLTNEMIRALNRYVNFYKVATAQKSSEP